MKATTMQLISTSGGRHNHYYQYDYIKANKWDRKNKNKRKGAWAGNIFDKKGKVLHYGLGMGVCPALAGAYLIAGNNWSRFQSYIGGEEGKGYIREMMNVHYQMISDGKGDEVEKVSKQLFQLAGLRFIKESNIPQASTSTDIGGDILKNIVSGFGYHISFFGPWGGHSIAMRIDTGEIKLFDPDLGEFTYPYQQNSSQGMANFIEHLFYEYYSPFYSIFVERYGLC